MVQLRKSKSERRAEIIDATTAVMLRKGFNATTTRDVTSRIGVGSGLLNHYFTWAELRRLAFETIARQGTAETFSGMEKAGATRIMTRMVKDAFARVSVPYLRVWIEAMDEAVSDRKLARSVNQCASEFRLQLRELIERGNDEDVWVCADPEGAAWRILAVHDGLVGFVLAGAPPLSGREAKKHFRIAITHECNGFSG